MRWGAGEELSQQQFVGCKNAGWLSLGATMCWVLQGAASRESSDVTTAPDKSCRTHLVGSSSPVCRVPCGPPCATRLRLSARQPVTARPGCQHRASPVACKRF